MKLGILGGGQLGRMMAMAAKPLEIDCLFWEPAKESCAAPFGEHLCASYDDTQALQYFLEQTDLCTYEFENLPADLVAALQAQHKVYPPLLAIEKSQDRLTEKSFLENLGIEVAPYAAVSSLPELKEAAKELGLPAILKTRRFGYDGKGQAVLRTEQDIETAWNNLNNDNLILEGFVNFQREVSQVAVRNQSGEIRFYALAENEHREGILHSSFARPNDSASEQAQQATAKLLEALDYVGVICVEYFDVNGKLIANEYAPRVHNSGHWTIEGAITSQFENHVRAVCNLPLGDTATQEEVAMLNIIGCYPNAGNIESIGDAYLHSYEKSEKPKRKIGHITLRSKNNEDLNSAFSQAEAYLQNK